MMEVKKYRAATTRAALEQIKEELGEDAFVLETKRFQKRGFLGFRSETQIEISAAPAFSLKDSNGKQFTKINLTDDTLAAPLIAEKVEDEKNVYNKTVNSAVTFDAVSYPMASLPKIEAVEISPDTPRFIHPKKEIVRPLPTELSISDLNPTENTAPALPNRELELLRAELREVKFSLGAMNARKKAQPLPNPFDLDCFFQVFEEPYYEAYIELTETGISGELARQIMVEIIPHYEAGFVQADEIARIALETFLASRVRFEADPLKQKQSSVMALIGATGVGKTTTIAKLAARLALHEGRRVELIALDTYRIAAVEQLKTYAEIIGAGCHVVRSVLELDVLLRRLPPDATVLIDTTGRSQHDLADQYELSEYLRLNQNIRKCLAIQASTNPFDAASILKKFEMYGADCLVLTKLDETMYPNALLETIAESKLPLAYICAGQRVPEDLQTATAGSFIARVFGEQRFTVGH